MLCLRCWPCPCSPSLSSHLELTQPEPCAEAPAVESVLQEQVYNSQGPASQLLAMLPGSCTLDAASLHAASTLTIRHVQRRLQWTLRCVHSQSATARMLRHSCWQRWRPHWSQHTICIGVPGLSELTSSACRGACSGLCAARTAGRHQPGCCVSAAGSPGSCTGGCRGSHTTSPASHSAWRGTRCAHMSGRTPCLFITRRTRCDALAARMLHLSCWQHWLHRRLQEGQHPPQCPPRCLA